MKALIAVTCVAVLAAVGYFFWGEYDSYRSHAQAEAARRLEADKQRHAEKSIHDAADQARKSALASGGCEQAATDLLFAVEMNTVKTAGDVNPRLANDMRICFANQMFTDEISSKLRSISFYGALAKT